MSKHKPCIGDYVMAECYKAELAKVKHQLAIAVEALKDIIKEDMYNLDEHRAFIEEKLKMIKELEK